jgi:hypothetical protein
MVFETLGFEGVKKHVQAIFSSSFNDSGGGLSEPGPALSLSFLVIFGNDINPTGCKKNGKSRHLRETMLALPASIDSVLL